MANLKYYYMYLVFNLLTKIEKRKKVDNLNNKKNVPILIFFFFDF